MADTIEMKENSQTIDVGESRNITIILREKSKDIINRFSREFYNFVLKLDNTVKEPTILPTAEAVFTTRKSPCGNGTATFSKHSFRVYQRQFDLNANDKDITRIADFLKSSGIFDAQLKVNF
ncbi:Rps10p [Glugoides intestinalis]